MLKKKEKRAAGILDETTVLTDGRYGIGLLWKERKS